MCGSANVLPTNWPGLDAIVLLAVGGPGAGPRWRIEARIVLAASFIQ